MYVEYKQPGEEVLWFSDLRRRQILYCEALMNHRIFTILCVSLFCVKKVSSHVRIIWVCV